MIRRWINKSYKNKLYSAYVFIWLTPFLLMLFFDYYYVYKSTVDSIEYYTRSNLKIAAQLIDSDLSTFTGIVNSVALNEEVAGIIKNDTLTSRKDFKETQRLYSIVQTSMAGLPSSVPIHIVNRYKQSRYSATNYFLPYYIDERGDLYETMAENAVTGRVSHQIHWRIDGSDSQDICYVLGRMIEAGPEKEAVGYVILDIFDSYFQDIFKKFAIQPGGNIIVIDKMGTVITDMNKQYYTGYKLNRRENAMLFKKTDTFEMEMDGRKYKVYFEVAEVSHLRVVELIPSDYFFKVTWDNISSHVMMFGSIFLLGCIMIYKNVKSIVTPIQQLDEAMNQVRQGDFTVRLSIAGEDEIARLVQTFNQMTKQTRQLITDNYQKNLALNKAEMKALKSQVNPHFLYNCLNSISMIASLGKNDEVIRMTNSLSRFYRYRVKTDIEQVPLSEELSQMESYLDIQRIRYRDKLSVKIEAEADIGNVKVLKLMLQPLVENAVIHGIEEKLGNGTVIIRAFYAGDGIKIQVLDDGNGFGSSTKCGEGTGLENVRQRLQYHYGSDSTLSIRREEPYTVVEIYIKGHQDEVQDINS